MCPIERRISGAALCLDLNEERRIVADEAILARSGRNARTLVKEGPLRITLITLAPGGEIPTHRADGPMAVQVLEGSMRVDVGDTSYTLEAGELLSLPGREEHAVASAEGATFLLTIAHVA
ncbi:MAG TPA: cupin domain-containing protein [Longimicrobiales bacterium]|nr:cupin domain-containing protein [Longimicrobiales bacterium]